MKGIIVLFMAFGIITGIAGCGTPEGTANPKETDNTKTNSMEISEHAEYGERDYELIVGGNNVLGMKLLKDLSARENGNIFVSPTSLYTALAMVYNGADGATKDEIANVLEVDNLPPEEMNRANASLISKLSSDSADINLNIANSIWVAEPYKLLQNFHESSETYYRAKIETIDMTDPVSSDLINTWVSDETNGKIKKMAEKPLAANMVAMLLNAVYFNGNWQLPFAEELTEEQAFYMAKDSTVQVPLMALQGELSYMETENFQAVSLPYGDGEMNMHVFLPAEDSSLAEFKTAMNEEKWAGWLTAFEPKLGTVMLPKFKMEYEVMLNDTLKSLGMQTAFSSVDLSNMFETSSGLFISEIIQKSYIDVSEKGTEAAASTSVAIAESTADEPSFEVKVNRPFFFAITDEETGAIVFMGSIENPNSRRTANGR